MASALNQVEAAILNGAADAIVTYEPQIVSALGGVEVDVINGALHVADEAFAKLPFGMGGLIDAALANYATTVEANLPQYTTNGLNGVAAYLKAVAAKLSA
jgi:hypothetical protein